MYKVNGEEYIQLKNWDKYQTQREDRVVASIFPGPRSGTITDVCQTDDGQVTAEVKLSKGEVKLSKVNEEKVILGEFKNVILSLEETQRLYELIGQQNSNILVEELSSYKASSGKRYKSDYATLKNWARRKFQQHMDKTKKTNIIGL